MRKTGSLMTVAALVIISARLLAAGKGDKERIEIRATEYAPGSVMIFCPDEKADPAIAAIKMNNVVIDYQKKDTNRRVRAAISIVSGGNTVAVHLWMDPQRTTAK